MNFVLLLTACVNPNGMAYTVLQTPNLRIEQYLKALKWYLANTKIPILFVENTGYDMSPMFQSEIESERLEILTFQGNDYDRSFGKGYGEALIIEYAINHSALLKKSDISIIKVTGRLICQNINTILKWISCSKTVLYANIELDSQKQKICNSRFLVAPTLFWEQYFLPGKYRLNDSQNFYFEHLLYEASLHWIADGYKATEFILPLNITGQSGTFGTQYCLGRNAFVKSFIRYWVHRLCKYYGPLNPFLKWRNKNERLFL